MDLRETYDLAVGPLLARELFQGRPVPLVERNLQRVHPVPGRHGVGDGAAEALGLDFGDERVAIARSLDRRADRGPDARNRRAERANGDSEYVGEPLRPQAARRVHGKDADQATLAGARKVDERPVGRHGAYRAEDPHARDRRLRVAHALHCCVLPIGLARAIRPRRPTRHRCAPAVRTGARVRARRRCVHRRRSDHARERTEGDDAGTTATGRAPIRGWPVYLSYSTSQRNRRLVFAPSMRGSSSSPGLPPKL